MSAGQDDLSHYIPRNLDSKGKFLFWDLDVAGVAIFGMMLGMGTGFPVTGLLVGLFIAYLYLKLKGGGHPGLAAHLIYWWGGLPVPKDLPPSHLREFNG